MPLGDLGHPRVEGRLVAAILLHGGDVAHWLQDQGVDLTAIKREFADATWPLEPTLGRPGADEPSPADTDAEIDLWLAERRLGRLGAAAADARLLTAIVTRGHQVGRWLRDAGISLDAVEAAFPGSSWR